MSVCISLCLSVSMSVCVGCSVNCLWLAIDVSFWHLAVDSTPVNNDDVIGVIDASSRSRHCDVISDVKLPSWTPHWTQWCQPTWQAISATWPASDTSDTHCEQQCHTSVPHSTSVSLSRSVRPPKAYPRKKLRGFPKTNMWVRENNLYVANIIYSWERLGFLASK